MSEQRNIPVITAGLKPDIQNTVTQVLALWSDMAGRYKLDGLEMSFFIANTCGAYLGTHWTRLDIKPDDPQRQQQLDELRTTTLQQATFVYNHWLRRRKSKAGERRSWRTPMKKLTIPTIDGTTLEHAGIPASAAMCVRQADGTYLFNWPDYPVRDVGRITKWLNEHCSQAAYFDNGVFASVAGRFAARHLGSFTKLKPRE